MLVKSNAGATAMSDSRTRTVAFGLTLLLAVSAVYLIDPDLGGSDDVRNLWPEPYSSTWNAHVKDALEDHLRELVCAEKISLAQAQHDISVDWISAYKKYFHTGTPLSEHLAFKKDQPWE